MDTTPDVIKRLNNEADLCRNDGAADIANLLDEAARAIDYFSSHFGNRKPQWVPSRISLPVAITSDEPFEEGPEERVDAGEHDCDSNQWGAMSVSTGNGQWLGVMPNECQIIGWRRNEKA